MLTAPHCCALMRWAVLLLLLAPTLSYCCTSSTWRCLTKLHLTNKDTTSMSIGRQSEKDAEDFVSAVVTGVNLGSALLGVANWPIQRSLDILTKGLSIISAVMSWFDFLASFVTPGGTGAGVLTWLRGGKSFAPL